MTGSSHSLGAFAFQEGRRGPTLPADRALGRRGPTGLASEFPPSRPPCGFECAAASKPYLPPSTLFRPHGLFVFCVHDRIPDPSPLPAPAAPCPFPSRAAQPGIQAQHPDLGDVFDRTLPLTLLGPSAALAPPWRSVCTCGAPRVPGIASASPQVSVHSKRPCLH